MWATKELLRSRIDLYHIIEIVRMAMGEDLNYPKDNIKRAWDVIAIITYSLLLSTFKKNFFIKNITYDKDLSTYIPKKYLLLMLIRYMFDFKLIRIVYAKFFCTMMPIMKTR